MKKIAGKPGYRGRYSEDEALGRSIDFALLKRMIGYLRPHRGLLVLILLVLLAGKFCMLAFPFVLKGASVSVEAGKGTAELFGWGGAGMLLLLLFFVLSWLEGWLTGKVGIAIVYSLRNQVYAHILRMPQRYFDRTPVGRLVTRAINDIDTLNDMFGSGFVNMVGELLMLFGIVAAMFYMDPALALCCCSLLPFLFRLATVFRRSARAGYRKVRMVLAALNSLSQEYIGGMSTVQAFGMERHAEQRFEDANNDHATANIEAIEAYARFFAGMDFYANAILIAFLLLLGLWRGTGGTHELSSFITFSVMLNMFFRPLRNLSERYNMLQSAMASGERIFHLLDTPAGPEASSGGRVLDGEIESVEFKDVWFAYEEERWVLRGVSFFLGKGETLALVGPTGSGKTTIISLLLRFYDIQKGGILINGVDQRDYCPQSLRRAIGVVLQDPFIFTGSIARNIHLGLFKDRARVEEAARFVNADEMIRRQAAGYDEEMREQGSGLSCGERQLLSFARAVAHEPRLLVLDEATSNIDTRSESLIQEALERMLAGRTAIVIAHRLSTIRRVSRILVIASGQKMEEGTHRELIEKRGIYAELYELQFRKQEHPA
ncbi:MAG: ABC transporter ATP-binding protein [Planctomycetes bacterium]|nr:ABC transporter ATP-binding protein [Planctomycetota bacterium]